MTFTPFPGLCSGFEFGTIAISTHVAYWGTCNIQSVTKHTGTYAMFVGHNWPSDGGYTWYMPAGKSDVYIGLWLKLAHFGGTLTITAATADSKELQLRITAPGVWAIYVDSVLKATGTITVTTDWHNLKIRFFSNDAGVVAFYVDGIYDTGFSGDTKPGASAIIDHITIRGLDNNAYVDDVSIGEGGYPNDLRYDLIVPDADISNVDWDLSAGVDAWDLVNEVPASDVDYIYTETNGSEIVLRMADWDNTNKIPKFLCVWARVKKDEADAHLLKLSIKDSLGNTASGSDQNVLTAYTYINEIFLTSPSGAGWDDAQVDDVRVALTATIV